MGKRRVQLRVKRVYEAATSEDGSRVLVDRLWPRGLSAETAQIDCWLREVAPSTALRRWFAHDPERWEEFVTRYHAELERNPEAVARLRELLRQGPLTLLYAAKDAAHNNAIALKAYLSK